MEFRRKIENLILELKKSTRSALFDSQFFNVPTIYWDRDITRITEREIPIYQDTSIHMLELPYDYNAITLPPNAIIRKKTYQGYIGESYDTAVASGKINHMMFIMSDGSVLRDTSIIKIHSTERCTYILSSILYTIKNVIVSPVDLYIEEYSTKIHKEGTYLFGLDENMLFTNELDYTNYVVTTPSINNFIIEKGKVTTKFIMPKMSAQNRLFKMNIFLYEDRLLVDNIGTDDGYNIFQLANNISGTEFEYTIIYYKLDLPVYDNLLKFENNTSIIDDIINSKDSDMESLINKITGDFDFRFNPNLSYKENMNNALEYIKRYNHELLDPLFRDYTKVYSVTTTGKDFLARKKNDIVVMSRRFPTGSDVDYGSYIIMYVNGLLYKDYDSIRYSANAIKIPTTNIKESDNIEFVYYKGANNAIVNTSVTKAETYSTNVFKTAEEIQFHTDDTMDAHMYPELNDRITALRKARYIRDSINGNNINSENTWSDIVVYGVIQGENLALSKPVYKSLDNLEIIEPLQVITDGDISNSYTGKDSSIIIDLERVCEITSIRVLHLYDECRVYHNHKLEMSEDGVTWYSVYDATISGSLTENINGRVYIVPKLFVSNPNPESIYPVPHIIHPINRPVRYIRNTMQGNTTNNINHFREIQAYDYDINNVALNKPVSASHPIDLLSGYASDYSVITDGEVKHDDYGVARQVITDGPKWVQVDLQEVYSIYTIGMWHYNHNNRKYHNNKLEVSLDGVNWTTIFDSNVSGEYYEESYGKFISLPEIESDKEYYNVEFKHYLDDNHKNDYNSSEDRETVSCRYIRHELKNNSSLDNIAGWREIRAYNSSGINVALNKTAYYYDGNDMEGTIKEFPQLVDGLAQNNEWVPADHILPTVEVDLGSIHNIDTIRIFNNTPSGTRYDISRVYVSTDSYNWSVVYNADTDSKEYISQESGNVINIIKGQDINNFYDKPLLLSSKNRFDTFNYRESLTSADYNNKKIGCCYLNVYRFTYSSYPTVGGTRARFLSLFKENTGTSKLIKRKEYTSHNTKMGFNSGIYGRNFPTDIPELYPHQLDDLDNSYFALEYDGYMYLTPGEYTFSFIYDQFFDFELEVGETKHMFGKYTGISNLGYVYETSKVKLTVNVDELGFYRFKLRGVNMLGVACLAVGVKQPNSDKFESLSQQIIAMDKSSKSILSNTLLNSSLYKLDDSATLESLSTVEGFNAAIDNSEFISSNEFNSNRIAYYTNTEGSMQYRDTNIISSSDTPSFLKDTPLDRHLHVMDGYINIPEDGRYTFITYFDDIGRLSIDDEYIAEQYNKKELLVTPTTFSTLLDDFTVDIDLTAGYHKIKLEHINITGSTCCIVGWLYDSINNRNGNHLNSFDLTSKITMDNVYIELPMEFCFDQNDNNYLLFLNKRRIHSSLFSIKHPSLKMVYDKAYLMINMEYSVGDEIDLIYTPVDSKEVHHIPKLEQVVDSIGEYSGFIDLKRYMEYDVNPQYLAVFANGKKVAINQLKYIANDSLLIKKDIGTIRDIYVYRENIFPSVLMDLIYKDDIWTETIKGTKYETKVTDYDYITDEDAYRCSPLFNDPMFIQWNTIYRFWMKRFGGIDASKRFTFTENLDNIYRLPYIDESKILPPGDAYVYAERGTVENISYTDLDGNDITGARVYSQNIEPIVELNLGNIPIKPNTYYSYSVQVWCNMDITNNLPYIKINNEDGTTYIEKQADLIYQNNDDLIPVGQWVTLHVDGIIIEEEGKYLAASIDLNRHGMQIEVRNHFLQENYRSTCNLRVIPIDASIRTGLNLPYNII